MKRGSKGKARKGPAPPPKPSPQAPAQPAGASSFPPQTKQTEHEAPPPRWSYKHPGETAIAAALGQYQGRVLQAAALLGVERNTLKSWIDASPVLQKARRDAREGLLEVAEDSLVALIRGEYFNKGIDEHGLPERHYVRSPSLPAIAFAYRLAGFDPDEGDDSDEEVDEDSEENQVVGQTEIPDNGRGPAL